MRFTIDHNVPIQILMEGKYILIYVFILSQLHSILLSFLNPNFNLGFNPTFIIIILLLSLLFYVMHKHIKLQQDALSFIFVSFVF